MDETIRPAGIDRRLFIAGAGAAAALGPLAYSTAARAETALSWVGWQGYDEPLKAGTFLKDNGLTLATTYINSNEEIITKLQAGGVGQTDMITIFFGHVPILINADLIEPIDEAKVPGLADVFPEFLNVDAIRRDGRLFAVPFTWGTLSMIYDPAAIPTPPESWNDVFKPEYKGKVAMVDDMTGLIVTWAPLATNTTTPTRLTMDQLKATVDLLIRIKTEAARTFSPSYGEATDLFARGEVVISAIGWDAQVGFAAQKNKTLAFTFPKEGVMTFMDTMCVPKGAPNRDLAYKAIAQSISPGAQKVMAEVLTQAVISKAAAPLAPAQNQAIYDYGNLAKTFERARFHQFWPLEKEGDFVTFDQVQEEWQRFLKA
jgi:spermidine/putrescine-binding protein